MNESWCYRDIAVLQLFISMGFLKVRLLWGREGKQGANGACNQNPS